MLYTAHYWIEGHYYNTVEGIKPDRLHGEIVAPFNQAWFCPRCASVWAKVIYKDAFNKPRKQYVPYVRHCRTCGEEVEGNDMFPPGSIIKPFEDELDVWPDKLIVREFYIFFNHHLQRVLKNV